MMIFEDFDYDIWDNVMLVVLCYLLKHIELPFYWNKLFNYTCPTFLCICTYLIMLFKLQTVLVNTYGLACTLVEYLLASKK